MPSMMPPDASDTMPRLIATPLRLFTLVMPTPCRLICRHRWAVVAAHTPPAHASYIFRDIRAIAVCCHARHAKHFAVSQLMSRRCRVIIARRITLMSPMSHAAICFMPHAPASRCRRARRCCYASCAMSVPTLLMRHAAAITARTRRVICQRRRRCRRRATPRCDEFERDCYVLCH